MADTISNPNKYVRILQFFNFYYFYDSLPVTTVYKTTNMMVNVQYMKIQKLKTRKISNIKVFTERLSDSMETKNSKENQFRSV